MTHHPHRERRDVEQFRRSVLAAHGAGGSDLEALLAYNDNVFDHSEDAVTPSFPLPDEPFVDAWERYAELANGRDGISALRRALVQLNFPIRHGISDDPAYRSVVRRGKPVDQCPLATGLALACPERIGVTLEATAAGRIGVIRVEERGDFENIVRALTRRNEPEPIPRSMGATMVSGYNNWDRIQEYRRAWSQGQEGDVDEDAWNAEFARLVPQRERYQDRFIIVSEGPYSGVDASLIGQSPDAWAKTSMAIRLQHECTHYFTKRVLGTMRNNLIDEIIADCMGMVGAIGRYRADWFACFMGLHGSQRCLADGRIGIYRGDPPLSDGAFDILQSLVRAAAENLERFDAQWGGRWRSLERQGCLIMALTRMTLEELASDQAVNRLETHLVMRSK